MAERDLNLPCLRLLLRLLFNIFIFKFYISLNFLEINIRHIFLKFFKDKFLIFIILFFFQLNMLGYELGRPWGLTQPMICNSIDTSLGSDMSIR